MKRFKSFSENNLDEMQEQKLLHIEKGGFWLLFCLIGLDLCVKSILGMRGRGTVSELICFVIAGLFVVVMCVKNGIWDRRLKANRRTNLLLSIAAAFLVAAINSPLYFQNAGGRWTWGILAAAAISALSAFVLIFTVLSVFTAAYKKRLHDIENEEDE